MLVVAVAALMTPRITAEPTAGEGSALVRCTPDPYFGSVGSKRGQGFWTGLEAGALIAFAG